MFVNDHIHVSAALDPETESPVPNEQETGWNPQLFWTFWRRELFLALLGIEPLIIIRSASSVIAISSTIPASLESLD
jgi:hypothetical protein